MSINHFQEDEIMGKAYDGRLMRRLMSYLRPYRLMVASGVALLLAGAVVDLLGPLITRGAIDNDICPALRVHNSICHVTASGSVAAHQRDLLLSVLLFLGTLLLGFAIRYAQQVLLIFLGQKVMYDLRMQVFTRLQHLPLSYFDRHPVGRLITRLTNDVDALNEMLTNGAVAIFGDVFTLAGIVIVLLFLNWRLALVTFLIMPAVWVFMNYIRHNMREAYRQVRTRLSRLNAFIAENISGTQIVQLFNREERNFIAFDRLNQEYLAANLHQLFYFSIFYPAVNMMASIATALIIWVGGRMVLREPLGIGALTLPGQALTIGTLVAFLALADRFFGPIRDLSEKFNILQGAMAASERIFGLLDEPITLTDPLRPVKLGQVRGKIEFRDVWFAYNPDEWVLKGVSFTIEPGESVAIVGATGAGKTSLISLLSRFYDVQRGAILIDGVDVRDMAQADLRAHIGTVLQDPFIFSGTIASNIRLHESRITDEQVRQAARFVNADRFIAALPDGFKSEVRERGAGLSVGQKQLLAFARAIAFNPEILLVLDEATSSVDTETEALIQDALARLMAGRTSIIIAHRLSTIRNVNRIIVLHHGRVVEQGSHDDLLSRAGIYRNLYELQYQ